MRNLLISLFIVAAIASLSSCKTIFTVQMKEKIPNDSISIQRIQFYNSHTMLLMRELSSDQSTSFSGGKITSHYGKKVEIVKIRRRTPGICSVMQDSVLQVAFERGDNYYLEFKNFGEDTHFQIGAEGWAEDIGSITYDGLPFFIIKGGNSVLMVKRSQGFNLETKVRVAKGRKVK